MVPDIQNLENCHKANYIWAVDSYYTVVPCLNILSSHWGN